VLFALILGLIGAVAAMYPARSAHNQWSHCNGGNNVFADQETANLYTGIAGRFFTHQPALNVNTQYSASHLYAFRDGGGTFVEVGLVRGIRDGWLRELQSGEHRF